MMPRRIILEVKEVICRETDPPKGSEILEDETACADIPFLHWSAGGRS